MSEPRAPTGEPGDQSGVGIKRRRNPEPERSTLLANDDFVQRQEEIATQRDLLTNQNQSLHEARQTIEKQNEEILHHNQILDLEVKERTKELADYNQQLEPFAFIAAHDLRAPVARILGLERF